tara:strand:- start:3855 stop:6146 length:2292 start_codon:yes stop_codon:yes gene_type:complete
MIISVPLKGSDFELLATDVIDTTAEFSNTDSDSFAVDQKLRDGVGIYQNTTGSVIPVTIAPITGGGTFTIGELVFINDGLGTDRLHIVTAGAGEAPKQPEDYITQTTSLDETDWLTEPAAPRYMKFQDKPIAAPAKASTKVSTSGANTPFLVFSHDGLYYFELSLGTTEQQGFYRHTLTTAYDITTPTIVVKTSINIMNGGNSARYIRFNAIGTKVFCVSSITNLIEEFALSTAYDMTTISALPTTTYDLINTYGFWFNNDGSKVYSIASNSIITQYSLPTNWALAGMTSDGTYDASAVGDSPSCTTFNSDGTILLINCNNVDGAGQKGLKYLTLTVPYDFTSGTVAYTTNQIIEEVITISQMSGLFLSPLGDKMFTSSTATPGMTYEWYLSTLNDVLNPYHSIFPAARGETRNGIVYSYSLLEHNGVYTFKSTVDGVAASFTPMISHKFLDEKSLEEKAYIGTNGTWLAKTVIIRPDGLYIRTNLETHVETETLLDYQFRLVTNVYEIDGFSLINASNRYRPFDDKNYSSASSLNGRILYSVKGLQKFDTLALGHVKADHILIEFWEEDGLVPFLTIDEDINTNRDIHGHLTKGITTLIYYSGDPTDVNGTDLMAKNSKVNITLTGIVGEQIELGTFLLGMSTGAGFTSLTLKNDYKDYSVFEYDTFGNADYTERAKVSRYSGSVDIFVENYDRTDRLMTSLGKNLVIINGSDSNSTPLESVSVFASTQKIGRFLAFNQKTTIKDNDMNRIANYTFTLEEIV